MRGRRLLVRGFKVGAILFWLAIWLLGTIVLLGFGSWWAAPWFVVGALVTAVECVIARWKLDETRFALVWRIGLRMALGAAAIAVASGRAHGLDRPIGIVIGCWIFLTPVLLAMTVFLIERRRRT